MQLNYSYLKILKLKIHSFFGHPFLCPCYSMTFYYLSHPRLFSPFLNASSPIFAVGFFEKPPQLTKDPKWSGPYPETFWGHCFLNGNFSLLTPWLPGGRKITSFEYLRSSKNLLCGVKYVMLVSYKTQ